jgi:Zn-dependent M28 family amino/carboxypeptidase
VVFESRGRAAARGRDEEVGKRVDLISRETFEADLVELVQFPTRFSASTHFAAACDFVDQRLAALGYTTSRQNIVVNGSPSQNVVARRDGSGDGSDAASRGIVLVTAHLDSINHEGDASSPAPGADDDGSGSAGVIAIACALKDYPGTHDLCLVLFGGEEQGLFGSKQFVASLAPADRARVRAVVNMDMIGTLNTPAPTVLLEGAELSQSVIDGLAAAAATYTGLSVQTSLNPFNSDHVSFIENGMPAVLTIEGADGANDDIHTARDTIDRINFDLALEILRMNTAFIAESLGRSAGTTS